MFPAARRQKKKSRRTAEVFSHAYSYTAAFERSKPPFLFIFSRNDAVSLLKAAAKGGSRVADRKPEHCLWERHTGRQGRTGYHKFTIHWMVSSFWLVWIGSGGSRS